MSDKKKMDKIKIDIKDISLVKDYKWSIYVKRNTKYAYASLKGKTISMHRLILGLSDRNIFVDHIDGNGINNGRSNLRIATRAQNKMNSGHFSGTSKYKGVHWDKTERVWIAQICIDKKSIKIGRFKCEDKAGLAYNERALIEFKEYARLNEI